MSSYQEQLEWGSFLPALVAAVADSEGDVLEIGIGHFSTPILHSLCMALGRKLVSVEDNAEWVSPLVRYRNTGHLLYLGDYDIILPKMASSKWGVVLIDNSPGGWRRLKDFEMFIDKAEIVLVHDYHRENEEAIKPMLTARNIKHLVVNDYQPPTLVASLTRLPKGYESPVIDLNFENPAYPP